MKYLVKKWISYNDQEQDKSEIEKTNLNLKEALDLSHNLVDRGDAVQTEIKTIEKDEQTVFHYEGREIGMKLFLELCEGCIEDLKEYNPYVHSDKNKTPVSLNEIITIKVDQNDCNNHENNLGIKNGIWMYV